MNIEQIIDEDLWAAVKDNFSAQKYTNAIQDAIFYLSNLLREKSELEDDGVPLVNSIFTKTNPRIRINKMETETERNIQLGTANILRGLYQSIRNPRSHEKYEDSEIDATEIILLVDYLARIIGKSKSIFEIQEYITSIFDDQYVKSGEYSKMLVQEIPKKKLLYVAREIYNMKLKGDIDVLQLFFEQILNVLNEEDKSAFFNIISNDLRKTNSDEVRNYIFKILPSDCWEKIDKIARIRTESRIIDSIREGKHYENKKTRSGWFATWCTDLFPFFISKEGLIITLCNKLWSDDVAENRYVFEFMFSSIWNLLEYDTDDVFGLLNSIISKIENGNRFFFETIKRNKDSIPEKYWEKLKNKIENFEEKKHRPMADDFDDDIPF